MNKKQAFLTYALVSCLIIFLARQKWNIVYLTVPQLLQVSFGWIRKPVVLALVCANIFIFDYSSISIPKNEIDSIKILIAIRKPETKALVTSLIQISWQYLVLFILVHLFAFDVNNFLRSLTILWIMIIIWLFLVFYPVRYWSIIVQNFVIFTILLGLRLIIFIINV